MPDGQKTFLLTGGTGFLGSHLLAALVQRGDRIIVAGRRAGEWSLDSRVDDILAWFGLESRRLHVETVEVDLLKPLFGLGKKEYDLLSGEVEGIIHCASDTHFSEKNRRISVAANVETLDQIVRLASCRRVAVHYISTAYVAGVTSMICTETFNRQALFANVYEETKAAAEKKLARMCRSIDIPFTIIRPSVVYGDSKTGRANRFNALYDHVKALWHIRAIYLKDITCNEGRKASMHGIHLGRDGILKLPLRVVLPRSGTINLIPIDYFVSTTLSLIEQGERGAIYHVTSDHPLTPERLAEYCGRFLRMEGIEIRHERAVAYGNPAEELFNRFIEMYRPYLSDLRLFDRSNTNHITAVPAPELSYEVFSRCMMYAESMAWKDQLLPGSV